MGICEHCGAEPARCQHCPNLADERSFMCEDCAGQADEEVQSLRDQLRGAVSPDAIERGLAEMHRILAADDLEPERQGDEDHERFVVRKVLEAGLSDHPRGAVGQ